MSAWNLTLLILAVYAGGVSGVIAQRVWLDRQRRWCACGFDQLPGSHTEFRCSFEQGVR